MATEMLQILHLIRNEIFVKKGYLIHSRAMYLIDPPSNKQKFNANF